MEQEPGGALEQEMQATRGADSAPVRIEDGVYKELRRDADAVHVRLKRSLLARMVREIGGDLLDDGDEESGKPGSAARRGHRAPAIGGGGEARTQHLPKKKAGPLVRVSHPCAACLSVNSSSDSSDTEPAPHSDEEPPQRRPASSDRLSHLRVIGTGAWGFVVAGASDGGADVHRNEEQQGAADSGISKRVLPLRASFADGATRELCLKLQETGFQPDSAFNLARDLSRRAVEEEVGCAVPWGAAVGARSGHPLGVRTFPRVFLLKVARSASARGASWAPETRWFFAYFMEKAWRHAGYFVREVEENLVLGTLMRAEAEERRRNAEMRYAKDKSPAAVAARRAANRAAVAELRGSSAAK